MPYASSAPEGFDIPLPAMSGAVPPAGSKMPTSAWWLGVKAYEALATWRAAVLSYRELEGGFEFACDYQPGTLAALAAFVTNERRRCPFCDFAIELPAAGGLLFRMTGPAGAKEILRAGL